MRTLVFRFGFLITSIFLMSCSDESKVKSVALENIKQTYESQLDYEIKTKITPGSVFKDSYREAIMGRTTYETEKIDIKETSATVRVKVTGVPYPARKALIEIIEKNVDKSGKSSNFAFNVSDALRLILKKMELPAGGSIDEIFKIELKKLNGDWQITQKLRLGNARQVDRP